MINNSNSNLNIVLKLIGSALFVGTITSISKIFFSPLAKLPFNNILKLANKKYNYNENNNSPLLNKIIIVTGSTSGLGKEIVIKLYSMGATIILASRTMKKMIEVKEELIKLYPDSKGTIIVDHILDTSDLDNVVEFSKWFTKNFKQLDYLVNNAGTLYTPPYDKFDPQNPPTSKQGYELAFVTNYMGHFLLTQLLLPTLINTPKSRILNIASSAHVTVSGNDLICQPIAGGLGAPVASQPCKTLSQWVGAYGNNKTAMLIHAKETQNEINKLKDKTDLKFFASCPGFTSTGMVPNGPLGQFLKRVFYPVEPAVYAPLVCLFDENLEGGQFITNFYNYWTDNYLGNFIRQFFNFIGLRAFFVTFIAVPWIIAFQNSSYGIHHGTTDSSVHDNNLTRKLYEWTKKEVQPYVNKFNEK